MVGKRGQKVSNDWKNAWKSFQWLETLKWECCRRRLWPAGPRGSRFWLIMAREAAGLPILAYYGPRGRGAPDFGLVIKGGGEYFCKFFYADGFGQVVIHSGC